MAYSPPAFNAINVDLKPLGSGAITIPAFNAVNVDLALEDGDTPVDPGPTVSDNVKRRNFAILLAI